MKPVHLSVVVVGSVLLSGLSVAQTAVDLRTQSKSVDFSAASLTKPFRSGTTLPGACAAGETYLKTAAPGGPALYLCAVTNAWTQLAPVNSVFGRAGAITAQNGDYSFSQIAGTASVAQGGTGAGSAVQALSNLGGAPLGHTHLIADLMGITGINGSGTQLQAFGGGTVQENECARFDSTGNLRSAGFPCGAPLPEMAGSDDAVLTSDGSATFWRGMGQGMALDSSQIVVDTAAVPQLGSANVFTDSNVFRGVVTHQGALDASTATSTKPNRVGAGVPQGMCPSNETYQRTDAAELYVCIGGAWQKTGGNTGLTSVGLTMPTEFSVQPSPLTVNGSITVTPVSQPANLVYAGPDGASGRPVFRALTSADLPNPSPMAGGKVKSASCSSGAFIQAIGVDAGPVCAAVSKLTDSSGNPVLQTAAVPSPVNWVSVSAAAAGSAPSIAAAGSETNVDLYLRGKGAGKVDLGNVSGLRIAGGGSGQVLQTDGTGNLSFIALSGTSEGLQPANTVKAGPASGADAAPAYRALTPADEPNLITTSGDGYFFPFPPITPGGCNYITAPSATGLRVWQFVLPFKATLATLRWFSGTSLPSSSNALAWGLYDSAKNRIAQTQVFQTTGVSLGAATFASPLTLAPGVYYLAFGADNTTVSVCTTTLSAATTVSMLNIAKPRFGTAVGASGAGSSFALPASLGTITADNTTTGFPPNVLLER